MWYKLERATIALDAPAFDGKRTLLKLPASAVLQVPDGSPKIGLIQVEWDGRIVSVFAQDVRERGHELNAGSLLRAAPISQYDRDAAAFNG